MILPTGYTYSPKLDMIYVAMERCGSKHVRKCIEVIDNNCTHNFDADDYLPDITNNILAVMRNPTHRLISAWELLYLTDREPLNNWFYDQNITVPWTPTTEAGPDECVKAFQDFVISLGELNEIVELNKFIRPQCYWYTSTDIEYIDISQIESHLGIDTIPYTIEKKSVITAQEYIAGNEQAQEAIWNIFEEDYLKLDYNIVPNDKYGINKR